MAKNLCKWQNKTELLGNKGVKNGYCIFTSHFTSYFLHFPNSSLHMANASLTAFEESEILQRRTSTIRVAAISGSINQNIQLIHSLLIRIEWTTGNRILVSSSIHTGPFIINSVLILYEQCSVSDLQAIRR